MIIKWCVKYVCTAQIQWKIAEIINIPIISTTGVFFTGYVPAAIIPLLVKLFKIVLNYTCYQGRASFLIEFCST